MSVSTTPPVQTGWLRHLGHGAVRTWKWIDRWFIWAWVGFPVGMAGLGYHSHLSQFSDIYDVARRAPLITRTGVVTRPDPRGRTLLLTTGSGQYPVQCKLDGTSSYCLAGNTFPLRARVTMFAYRGYWMIAHVEDIRGRSIISFDKRLFQIKSDSIRYRVETPKKSALDWLYIGIGLDPLLVIGFYGQRRQWRRQAEGRKSK